MTTHHKINVSPFATNVLDLVGRTDLVTPTGIKVTVTRDMLDFVVTIGDERMYCGGDNLSASYTLNQFEVGIIG